MEISNVEEKLDQIMQILQAQKKLAALQYKIGKEKKACL